MTLDSITLSATTMTKLLKYMLLGQGAFPLALFILSAAAFHSWALTRRKSALLLAIAAAVSCAGYATGLIIDHSDPHGSNRFACVLAITQFGTPIGAVLAMVGGIAHIVGNVRIKRNLLQTTES